MFLFGKLLCLVDAIGQSLLSQATDITLIFRGVGCHLQSRLPASAEDSEDKGKMFQWQGKRRQASAALISDCVK